MGAGTVPFMRRDEPACRPVCSIRRIRRGVGRVVRFTRGGTGEDPSDQGLPQSPWSCSNGPVLPSKLPTLTDGVVTLRRFQDQDVSLVQSVAEDPLIPLITTVPTTGTADDAAAHIERQHERLRSGTGYSFAITETMTNRAVGQIGLWLRNIDQGRASTGYWIALPFRHRGLATRALRLLSDWALAHDEVHRLELYVEPWNSGSWRAAEACDFHREGLLRSWQLVGTMRKDMYVYSPLSGPVSEVPMDSVN